jgi:hypothetical protein
MKTMCVVAVLTAQGLANVGKHRQEVVGASSPDTRSALVGELLMAEVVELVVPNRSELEMRDDADQVPTSLGAYPAELLRLANAPLLGCMGADLLHCQPGAPYDCQKVQK